MITLKLATSLDGRIATGQGDSRWITGPEARTEVHRLRAEHDAVLVGAETALADDPDLTVRLPGYAGPQPARVVLDSRQRLPPTSRLARSAQDIPVHVVATGAPDPALLAAGVQIIQVPALDDGRPDLPAVVAMLAARGLRRLFVEGGGQVAASFLRCGLVDRMEWFRGPQIIGDEGRPAIGGLCLSRLDEAPRLRRIEVSVLGEDLWERYERI
ncbi:RibD family protein [Phenylobacterium sp.]|uniref:RibD family protein n=1 Tax=Phenylobacterium sp. TaxID=1871053 RepID=UPI00272F6012|nr:RibD family protein [Phenylobacterium sp.]MDP1618362.1 RibD family protein [Phenylobacterium sp.]MDP1985951.1 RibD family protein [Phenylobacterium sp.]